MKYVDLGLSVLWADCNIGANTPEEYGNYYKWDEMPKEYEIPTLEQYKELIEKCTWTWTTQNGVNGFIITSKKNGNSIFLPAADTYNTVCHNIEHDSGNYWSSSPCTKVSDYAYLLDFYSDYIYWDIYDCCNRLSVRAIKSKINFKNKTTMTLKEVNEIIPLKSGMCLELSNNNIKQRLILFQYGCGELCYTNYNDSCHWAWVKYLDYNKQFDTIKVYQSPTVNSICNDVDLIFNSDDYKVEELTMQEIADKFGIKVENLRIKE